MHRRLIMGLLALGTITGYASGFAHVACAHRHWREHQRAEFVREVAQACTDASRGGGAPAAWPRGGPWGAPAGFAPAAAAPGAKTAEPAPFFAPAPAAAR